MGTIAASFDSLGAETILSSRDRTWVVPGAPGAQENPAEPSALIPVRLLSDVAFEGSLSWAPGAALAEAGSRNYLVCARDPAALFAALSSYEGNEPLTPVLIYGHRLVAGPVLRGQRSPCPRCWVKTVLANLPSLAVRVQRGHRLVSPGAARVRQLVDTVRTLWEAPEPTVPQDRALSLDLDGGTMERQRLLPTLDCTCEGPLRAGRVEDLEGDVLGLVTRVAPPSGVTSALPMRIAFSRLGGGAAGCSTGLDAGHARQRALAEAAERLADSTMPASAFIACHAEVSDAVPLETLQHAAAMQGLDASLPVHWMRGQLLEDGQPQSIPLALCSLAPHPARRWWPSRATGVAAAPSLGAATQRALLELAERDVLTRAWYEGRLLRLEAADHAPGLVRLLEQQGLRVHAALAPNGMKLPAVVAFVEDPREELGARGFSASWTVALAVEHAIEEAVQMRVRLQQQKRPLQASGAFFIGLPAAPSGDLLSLTPDLLAILRRYRPVSVDLTNRHARAVSLHVVSVWSPHAAAFPRGPLLCRGDWTPNAAARARLDENPFLEGTPDA